MISQVVLDGEVRVRCFRWDHWVIETCKEWSPSDSTRKAVVFDEPGNQMAPFLSKATPKGATVLIDIFARLTSVE